MYTHILIKRLTRWLSRKKDSEQQVGFGARYSTVDHIFYIIWICAKICIKKYKTVFRIADLKKKKKDIFNRNALWAVLRKAGVIGKMYKAHKGIYTSVSACVREKCSYTDFFKCL